MRKKKSWKKKSRNKLRWIAVGLAALILAPVVFLAVSIKLSQQYIQKQERNASLVSEYGFVDVPGQIHVHSYLSHDSNGSLAEIAESAKQAGVKWVILTDHLSKDYSLFENPMEISDTLLIFGQEMQWNGQGSHLWVFRERNGELNLYGHIEKFKNLDGHNWDAVEIVNFHSNLMASGRWARLCKSLFYYPFNFYSYFLIDVPRKNLDYWQKLSERLKKPIPIFAATDAHQNLRVLGLQLDPYGVMLKLASTHIFVEDRRDSGLEPILIDSETVCRAIQKGRTYVAFDWLGDTTGFQFWMERGEKKFFSGSIVRSPDKLVIKNPETTRTEIRIFRDNQMVARKEWVRELVIDNPAPGFWRVEIWRDGQIWIMSSQILVK